MLVNLSGRDSKDNVEKKEVGGELLAAVRRLSCCAAEEAEVARESTVRGLAADPRVAEVA